MISSSGQFGNPLNDVHIMFMSMIEHKRRDFTFESFSRSILRTCELRIVSLLVIGGVVECGRQVPQTRCLTSSICKVSARRHTYLHSCAQLKYRGHDRKVTVFSEEAQFIVNSCLSTNWEIAAMSTCLSTLRLPLRLETAPR